MILILSQTSLDPTTEEVLDWLESFGIDAVRLNGEDLDGDASFSMEVDADGSRLRLPLGGADLPVDDVDAVWYRRWEHNRRFESTDLFGSGVGGGQSLAMHMVKHLSFELWKASNGVFDVLRDVPWLCDPDTESPTKATVLRQAASLGFDIPATLVTTSRRELRLFLGRHGRLITKPVGEPMMYFTDDRFYTMYTSEIGEETIEELPPSFFPSLFQERLEKEYEIRVFYLDGRCFPMAIFSQLDAATGSDYRRYNRSRPNRCVPYALEPETEERIQRLMERLRLETGSLDLVQTPDGRTVFLEVNPVGQFGMVSKPCNYRLERRVAAALARRANDRTGAPDEEL